MNDFWSYENFKKLTDRKKIAKPKLITAIGMFYDLEDPSKFIRDINLSLDDNGIFIAQLMCLKSMLEKNDLGNICHEHLEYYSYKSLIYLLKKMDFRFSKLKKMKSILEAIEFTVKRKFQSLLNIKKKLILEKLENLFKE